MTDPAAPTTPEPATKAGRAYLYGESIPGYGHTFRDRRAAILAIEAAARSTPAETLDLLSNLVDAVTALENRSIRSVGEFHVWAEERMVTEARDEARALLARLRSPESDHRGAVR